MELHPLVRIEWRDDHWLSPRSLLWIEDHADPGDLMPIVTAITQLRADLAAERRPPIPDGRHRVDPDGPRR